MWVQSLSPLLVVMSPGEGGGGGGGGATVGGQSGGPWQITSHWLMQVEILEPASGPGPPTSGQPQPPLPETKQGPHTVFVLSSSVLYAIHMHLERDAEPAPKHCPAVTKPLSLMQLYSGCTIDD